MRKKKSPNQKQNFQISSCSVWSHLYIPIQLSNRYAPSVHKKEMGKMINPDIFPTPFLPSLHNFPKKNQIKTIFLQWLGQGERVSSKAVLNSLCCIVMENCRLLLLISAQAVCALCRRQGAVGLCLCPCSAQGIRKEGSRADSCGH